jgi:hypothetical protein
MPPTSRGYTRGARPASPGDLTGQLGRRNQQEAAKKAEAAKRGIDADEIRRAALAEGIDRGFDRGWDAGYAAALQQLMDAGLDVEAVLALDADDAEGA